MDLVGDVGSILSDRGFGTVGRDILLSQFADFEGAPDDMIVLYEYAGLPLNDMDPAFCQMSLQVCVRSKAYTKALDLAQQISALLRDIGNAVRSFEPIQVGNTRYYRFKALQPPYPLKEDEMGRTYITQNYRVWARPMKEE